MQARLASLRRQVAQLEVDFGMGLFENKLELEDHESLVTEMKEIKHPFHAGIYAQQGIEF